MSTRFYHCRWRVYAHEVIEQVPNIKPSELFKSIVEYKLAAGDCAYDRKYCASCYRKHVILERALKERRQLACPGSCPEVCPNHTQMRIFGDNP